MKGFILFNFLLFVLFMASVVWSKKVKCSRNINFFDFRHTTILKGASILTVIFSHTGAYLGINHLQFIAGVGVCIFLICSGYGLMISFEKNGIEGFWYKKFTRIFIIYYLVHIIGCISNGTLSYNKFFVILSFRNQWYMTYLVVCYIIFYLCFKGNRYWKSLNVSIVILCVAFSVWFILDSLFFLDSDMPVLHARQMLSFPFGVILAEFRLNIQQYIKEPKKISYVSAILFLIGIVMTGFTQIDYVKNLPVIVSNILSLFTVYPLALAVIWFVYRKLTLFDNNFFYLIGAISYEIYLVQYFTLYRLSNTYNSVITITFFNFLCGYLLFLLNEKIIVNGLFRISLGGISKC